MDRERVCSIASDGCSRWNSGSRSSPTCSVARCPSLDSLLSEKFSNETSLRLMAHAASLDLEDFEDSELQDRLERARRQAAGRSNLIGQLFGQAQDVITVASFAAGLVVYAPWLIALLAIALVPAFIGEAHFNAQSYSLNYVAHAGAARARLRPADGGQRGHGQGSEDLRPERAS